MDSNRYITFVFGILSLVYWVQSPAAQTRVSGVSGLVLDAATGLPVPDAKVSLVHVNDPTFPPPPSADSAITKMVDSAGNYFFPQGLVDSLSSHEVLMFAEAAGYGFSARKIPKSRVHGIQNFELFPRVKLSGTVANKQGMPLERATVGIVYVDAVLSGSSTYFPWQYEGVSTDSDGKFSTEVSPGYTFVVEASHDNFLPSTSSFNRVPRTFNELSVPGFVQIQLSEGLHVSGTVVDSQGLGVAEVRVRLSSKSRRIPFQNCHAFVSRLEQIRQTDSNGRFTFEAVASGGYDISVATTHGKIQAGIKLERNHDDIVVVIR